MSSALRTLVFDFDGTFTDIEAETVPFQPAMMSSVADLLNRDVREDWAREQARIEHAPEQHGWVFDGRVVAPATADPYLLGNAVMQAIFDGAAILRNPRTRTAITQALYTNAYEQTLTAFRDDALDVLEAALSRANTHVYVVTNSDTQAVTRKLEKLLGPGTAQRVDVRGNAKKFWVVEPAIASERFNRVPEMQRVPQLVRPIYLRRGKYFEALHDIWERTKTTPEETLVCGDIYELDLALPAALGATVALAPRRNTLAYERDAVTKANGRVLATLSDVKAMW
ncbi:MAG: HAD family hydrolase [Labilithrix sp.]|nr:HAD family hydrolase [Labilithrix sp.]MCW5814899.1 HAD family hydrolase [Labilithrix sp.]